MTWHEAWGTWKRDEGVKENVAMVGSPNSSIFGLDLTRAKQAGYGNGIKFTSNNNEGTSVTVQINLIGMSQNPNTMRVILNDHYRDPQDYGQSGSWTYSWYVEVAYSTTGRNGSYSPILNQKIADHTTPQALTYANYNGSNWKSSGINVQGTLNLPSNFTHLRVEVFGERADQRMYNYFAREVVIPPPPPPPPPQKIKPWAIRKSSMFKTLDRQSGFFKIRRSVNFVSKSDHLITDVRVEDRGVARVRKSNKWLGQNKIGEN